MKVSLKVLCLSFEWKNEWTVELYFCDFYLFIYFLSLSLSECELKVNFPFYTLWWTNMTTGGEICEIRVNQTSEQRLSPNGNSVDRVTLKWYGSRQGESATEMLQLSACDMNKTAQHWWTCCYFTVVTKHSGRWFISNVSPELKWIWYFAGGNPKHKHCNYDNMNTNAK